MAHLREKTDRGDIGRGPARFVSTQRQSRVCDFDAIRIEVQSPPHGLCIKPAHRDEGIDVAGPFHENLPGLFGVRRGQTIQKAFLILEQTYDRHVQFLLDTPCKTQQ